MKRALLNAWQAITARVVAPSPAADHAVLSPFAADFGAYYVVELIDEMGRETFEIEGDYGTAMAAAARRAAEASALGYKVVEIVLGWDWFLPGRGSSIVVSYLPAEKVAEMMGCGC